MKTIRLLLITIWCSICNIIYWLSRAVKRMWTGHYLKTQRQRFFRKLLQLLYFPIEVIRYAGHVAWLYSKKLAKKIWKPIDKKFGPLFVRIKEWLAHKKEVSNYRKRVRIWLKAHRDETNCNQKRKRMLRELGRVPQRDINNRSLRPLLTELYNKAA